MNIYWAGGEDIDFLDSGTITINTTAAFLRNARQGVAGNAGFRKGSAFAAGAQTSLWFGAMVGFNYSSVAGRFFGVVKSSTASSGLWVGINTTAQITLVKYDGTTFTTLATSAATYFTSNTNMQRKIDVQLVSYGASATVNVYVESALALTYTGDVTVSGVTSVDCMGLGPSFGNFMAISEFIAADTDTRSLWVATMVGTSAGTTTNWTGAYTDANESTNSDATNISTNAAAQDEQFNITDLPAGTFEVVAVRVAARAALAGGSTPTGLKLGFRSGGSNAVGSNITPGVSYALAEQTFTTNPVTSAAWALADMNALQVMLQSQ